MIVAVTRADLRRGLESARANHRSIALVPTMGYLHEGHLSLVDLARKLADCVVMSIFVNPLQFSPGEDLEQYPRDLPRDRLLAAGSGVDLLFAPETAEMYPAEPSVFVDAPGLTDRLCGEFRPGHFRGVLTVVAKLFHLVQPDIAIFGQKDYQQLTLIRRMVRELDMLVAIVAGPIIREADGLAMSSRNVYLDPAERRDATLLHASLLAAQSAFASGTRDAASLIGLVRDRLATGASVRPQYVELVRPDSLESVSEASPGDVLAIAALVGRTRLIDNHMLRE